MKHFLFNLTKNTAKEARITGGGASQVGTKSRVLRGNPRLYRYPCATLALPLRYAAMITLLLTLACGEMWGAETALFNSFSSTTKGNYFKNYTVDSKTVTVATDLSISSSSGDYYVSLGSTPSNNASNYIELSVTSATIKTVSVLITGNGSDKTCQPALLGWTGAIADNATADYVLVPSSRSISNKGLSNAEWHQFDVHGNDLTKVRIYRAVKGVNVGGESTSKTTFGNAQSLQFYGIRVELETSGSGPSVSSFTPASGSKLKTGATVTVAGSSGSTVYCLWASSAQTATAIKSGTAGTSGAASVTSAGIASANGTTLYAVAVKDATDSDVSSATYTIDDTAPTLSSSTPANGANNIPLSGNIVLTFSENVAINDASKFTISPSAGVTLSTGSATASSNTVTIPYSGLSSATTYTFSSAAGAVKDEAGNTSAALSDISFTTYRCAVTSCGNADITYTINGGSSGSHSTGGADLISSATPSNTTALGASTTPTYNTISMSDLDKKAAATSNYCSETPNMSGKISMYSGSSYSSSNYLQFTCTIKSGYTFTPCDIQFVVQPVSYEGHFRWEITDGSSSYGYGIGSAPVGKGNGATVLTGLSSTSEMEAGTYYIRLYPYYNGSNTFRIGDDVVLRGTVAAAAPACTAPNHVDITGSWRYFPGQTISLTATAYSSEGTGSPIAGANITGYQWQKEVSADNWSNLTNGTSEGVTISGATSSNLQISPCGTGNTGNYRCIVSTGATCSTTSSGYGVKIYTLNGGYDGGDWSSNNITYSSGTAGTATVHLEAGRVYKFKVTDNFGTWFGNSGRILEPAVNWDFSSGEDDNCFLFTGPEGDYVFTVDYDHADYGTPEVVVSVAYPSVTHPAAGYAYFKNVDDWEHVGLYMWYAGGGSYTDWGSEPWVTKTTTICGDTYYYTPLIPSWYNRVIFREVGGTGQTSDITVANLAAYSGKYNDMSDGNWHDFATYDITFDKNGADGGTDMTAVEDIVCNGSVTLDANTWTKTGYSFNGWKDGSSNDYADEATISNICGDIELTAQWTVQSYNLTWNLAGGTTTSAGTGIASGVSSNTTTSQNYGTSLTAPTVTKANYDFSAWSPAVASTMPAAATTYTATWTAQTHDVAFTLSKAAYKSGTDEGDDVATYGTDYEVVFKADDDYVLPSDITVTIGGNSTTKGTQYTWNSSTGALTVYGSYITGNIAISITAVEDAYTVTYAAGGGSGSVPTDDNSYDSGDEVTVAANTLTKSGYTFVGWSDGTTLFLEGQKFNITDNVTLTAVWKSNGTTVTLTHFGKQFKTSDPRLGYAYVGSTSGTKYIIESNSSDVKNSDSDSSAIRLPYSAKYLKVLGPGATTSLSDSLFTGVTQISFKWKYAGSTTNYTTDLDVYVGSVKVATKSLTGNKNDDYATATISGIAYKNGAVKIVNTGSSSSNQKFDIDDISITYGSASGKTVTFNKGSGPSTVTGMPSKIEGVTSGLKILEPEDDPEAEGYIFDGWVTTSGGSTSVTFPATIDKDTTIYAKWTAKSTPTKYNVTGTPVGLCGEETATISLAGSQSGISYQLYKGGVAEGDPIAGTGSALSWKGKGTGVYTIWTVENATYASVQMDNTGYTTVTVTAITETDITTQPTTPVTGHDGVNFTVGSGMVPAGESLEYQWYSYTSSVGAGEDDIDGATDATYTTSKSAGTYYYKVKVSGTCGDPVYSDMITVTVDNKHKLTYDANGGSGAPEAEFRAAGSAALSATEPTKTNYRFLGWNTEDDGTGDHYDAGASYTMGTSAVTLYAEWGETATLTWNLNVNTAESSIGTASKASTNARISNSTDMTNLANYGSLTITSSAKANLTSSIGTPASYDADKYMYVTFEVPDDYEFVPTSISVKVQPVSTNKDVKLILTDGVHTITKTQTNLTQGTITTVTETNSDETALTGTVTLKIYCYGATDAYRLGSPITIAGNLNYVCPERATITSPTAPQSIKLYTDQSKTLTVSATAYSSGTLHYQWKKDGVNIAGATSASLTVYGSIDGTAGETYVYTCDVTQTSPDACATVTSPAVSITFASTSCGYTEIASAVLTAKNSATTVNATALYQNMSNSSAPYKLDKTLPSYFGLQLSSGNFEVGDSIIFKVKINDMNISGYDDYPVAFYHTTDTSSYTPATALYIAGGNTKNTDNVYIRFIVTQAMIDAGLTNKILIIRSARVTQNHSMYEARVKRYACPGIFIYDDAAETHEWSDEDNWIGPAGHGSGLPTSDDRIFINKSVTVDVATASAAEMHITNGSVVTVEKSITVGDVIIETGSTLNIAKDGDDGITVATNSLYLKGGWNSSETKYDMPRIYIDPASTLTKEVSTVNFDISVNHYNYYPIAVPFRVKVKAVDYANSFLAGYSEYGVTGQYVIKEYDGERRAEKGPDQVNNWKVVPEEDKSGNDVYLEPGKGYIMTAVSLPAYGGGVIRFPLSFDDAWTALGEQGTVSAVTKNVVAVTAYVKAEGETKNANKGWNLLGVPFMSCYATGSDMTTGEGAAAIMQGKFNFADGTWDGEDTHRYVNVPVHDFSEYIQTDITAAASVLRPGWCFFVQIATSGNLKFLTADQAASSSLPIYAPRREQTVMPTVETGIILSDGEKSDKTTFLVSDKYSASEYEINADLEKLFGNGYTLATYSLSGETRLAYNALSNADAANIIPIGYRAPADGEYTFALNPKYAESGAFEHINLIDYTTGIVTDLLQSSYTFSTERTQNDARFALNVVPRQEMPTGLENGANGANDANGVRKLIINDQLFIIRDGQMYDATGRMVK